MLNEPLKIGTKIWRAINGHVKGPYIEELSCGKAERGDWFFKADSGRGHFTKALVAMDHTCKFGLVCFVDEPPVGSSWTHFEVIHAHRSGKSVRVRAVMGDREELYAQYDREIGNCQGLIKVPA
jgi:hypothetical protein